jgi:hypothetical protein
VFVQRKVYVAPPYHFAGALGRVKGSLAKLRLAPCALDPPGALPVAIAGGWRIRFDSGLAHHLPRSKPVNHFACRKRDRRQESNPSIAITACHATLRRRLARVISGRLNCEVNLKRAGGADSTTCGVDVRR